MSVFLFISFAMCGIIGLVNSDNKSQQANQALIDGLTILQHRGGKMRRGLSPNRMVG